MKKRRTGQYFEKSGRAYYRLSTDDGRPSFPIALDPGPAAEQRAKDIAGMVDELQLHGAGDEIVSNLVERAALAPTPAFFEPMGQKRASRAIPGPRSQAEARHRG